MFAPVITAGVSFAVVMVIAVEVFPDSKSSCSESFSHFADITIGTADHFYTDIAESVDRTAADTAANKNIDLFQSEQCGECTVTGIAAGKYLFTDDRTYLILYCQALYLSI